MTIDELIEFHQKEADSSSVAQLTADTLRLLKRYRYANSRFKTVDESEFEIGICDKQFDALFPLNTMELR